MNNKQFRSTFGLSSLPTAEERSCKECFELFCRILFSAIVSTEEVKRGNCNEAAVIAALRASPFLKEIFDAGLIGMQIFKYVACSPDGVSLLRLENFPDWESGGSEVLM